MAKLEVLPEEAIISGFKKTIDFYVYRGQPCARMWPRKPRLPRAATTQPMISAFRYAMYAYSLLTPAQLEPYKSMATGTDLTTRDYFMRAYLGGIDY